MNGRSWRLILTTALSASAAALFVLAAPGCSQSADERCDSVCQQNADQCNESPADCQEGCRELARLSESAGCESAFDAALDCVEGAQNPCDNLDECRNQLGTLFQCFDGFCETNPKDPACPQPDETPDTPDPGGS